MYADDNSIYAAEDETDAAKHLNCLILTLVKMFLYKFLEPHVADQKSDRDPL